MGEIIQKVRQGFIAETPFQHKGEQATAPGKIAFPECMSFTAGQRRMINTLKYRDWETTRQHLNR